MAPTSGSSKRTDAPVPLTAEEVVELLAATSRPAEIAVRQHRDEYDSELLLHLLVANLRRLAIEARARADADVLVPLLAAMGVGLVEGDGSVRNAVAVSFVEDTGCWDPGMAEFITSWPAKPSRRDRPATPRIWRMRHSRSRGVRVSAGAEVA